LRGYFAAEKREEKGRKGGGRKQKERDGRYERKENIPLNKFLVTV